MLFTAKRPHIALTLCSWLSPARRRQRGLRLVYSPWLCATFFTVSREFVACFLRGAGGGWSQLDRSCSVKAFPTIVDSFNPQHDAALPMTLNIPNR